MATTKKPSPAKRAGQNKSISASSDSKLTIDDLKEAKLEVQIRKFADKRCQEV
jgi:hypothetical protein